MTEAEQKVDPKAELTAMSEVLNAVEGLPEQSVTRVLNWVAESLGVKAPGGRRPARQNPTADTDEQVNRPDEGDAGPSQGCADAASFVDKSGASDGNERALAVAYWLQVVSGKESWSSLEVNTELKHQGHGLANVTVTMSRLMKKKPALVVQLKKTGTSRQARKLYKVTSAGEKAVVEMFARDDGGS